MALLKVEPTEIRFEDVLPGTLYVMTFSVRNLSQVAQRVRLSAPKSGLFALNYIPAGALAPGLDLRAEIECQIPAEMTDFVFTDKIVATMGNERIEIPISALKPHARIQFDRELPFGNILRYQTAVKDIVFTNLNGVAGTMKLSTNRGSLLKLSTNRLDFKPKGEEGSSLRVQFTIEGKEPGLLRELVKVQMQGAVEEMHIDVSAQIIEQNLTLLSENQAGMLESAEFGNIYFGEVVTVRGLLVNSGPLPLSFTVKFEDEDETANNAASGGIQSVSVDPNAALEQFYSKSISASPMDGIVKPFSQVVVSLTFTPTIAVPEKGFIQQHMKDYEEARLIQRVLRIECLDSSQVLPLTLRGFAHIPAMSISPAILRFGDCPVNDRRDILVTLSNRSKLPLVFEFPVVATFKFQPSKGRVMPREHLSVIASFLPPQLGPFKTQVPLVIGNGLKEYSIKVVGHADAAGATKKLLVGGTDKLPDDFVPHYKFVDPEEEATSRLEKRQAKEMKALATEATLRAMLSPTSNKRKMFSLDAQPQPVKLSDLETVQLPPVIHASSEHDAVYGTDGNAEFQSGNKAYAQKLAEERAHQQLQQEFYDMTKQHNQGYNDYLQQSHHARTLRALAARKAQSIERGAVDFSDPFGVNLGMERGLDEPALRLPEANEPLWTASGPAGQAGSAAGGTTRKPPTDENRLIQKKYPASPSTQAELRDCSKELSTDDLKLVSASHKLLEFGKVCVGSVTAKSFVVFNNLHHSILISVEDLEIELQQSRALVQVIPTNCMAGFDIVFSSRVVGKIRKTFTWKVNGIHVFKVAVSAEVIPIDLVLSKPEIVMEFPIESTKPTLTTEIVVSNPGNAHAEFLWGSVGAFTCDPEKGSIAPGKSSVVSITWDPLCGKRAEEELGLHVSGGNDQVLKVRGVLKDTKAEFQDKRLSLGVMAVGTEKEFVTTINNVGQHELVYFISALDDSLGIRIEPTEALIMPGESGSVRVTVTPKSTRNYDNVSIHAKIRGGKSISLRLAGSSIVPQIEIEQANFVFGAITVGSYLKLPLVIHNKSPIVATLLMNLGHFEDFAPSLCQPIEPADITVQEVGPVAPLQEDDFGNSVVLVSQQQGGDGDASLDKKSKKRKHQADHLWRLTLLPNASLVGELIFRPKSPKKYSFKLPLHLLGIVEDRSLQRDVTALGVQSVLRFSSPIVDFGDKVVARDPLARVSYFLETTITNQSNVGVSFVLREGDELAKTFDGSTVDLGEQKLQQQKAAKDDGLVGSEPQQIFFVSPLALDLAAGASMKVRVTFLPQQNLNYSKKLGFFPRDAQAEHMERPYLSLLCVGSGVYPCLTFSHQLLQLPTVPLGVTSRASFFVFNNGYAALDIRHRLSPNVTVPVDVSYPDGNQVGIMVDRVRVVVSVKTSAAASWLGKLEFFDNDGERFFIQLSGCSDNCLLSNYPFVRDYQPDYGFVGVDEQPVQFLPQHEIAELRQWEARRKEEQRRLRSLERQRLVAGKTEPESPPPGQKKSVKIKDAAGSPSTTGAKKGMGRKESQRSVGMLSDADGSQQQPNFLEGVDLDRAPRASDPASSSASADELEAVFLLIWLNKEVCRRPFDAARFPYCMFENGGETSIDCIEQMSGKKIPGTGKDSAADGAGGRSRKASDGRSESAPGGRRQSEKGKLIAVAEKLVQRFQQLLSFLISHGALLAHVSPLTLLHQPEYLLMTEHELTKDRSVRVTPSMLAQRREEWRSGWLQACSAAWLEVMYQAVKVFVLARLTYKSYLTTPGVVITTAADVAPSSSTSAAKQKGKKEQAKGEAAEKKQVVPKDLQASNVFTHSEGVLLAWATYHLERAENLLDDGATTRAGGAGDFKLIGANKRVFDLDLSFRDFFSFCQLLHSHVGVDITSKGEPLRGYTNIDRSRQEELFAMFDEAAHQYHCKLEVTAEDVLRSSRNVLLLLLHMYLSLPQLVPKSKIDFHGILGEPIGKRIEIKNPAKKPLLYEVSLKGCDDFVPEATQLLVPGEAAQDFLVTLRARFQHQVAAKLYFWNVREPAYASGPTLCFQCVSDIRGVKPLDSVTKQLGLFDYEIFQLPVRNPYGKEVTLQVRYEVRFCPKRLEDVLRKDGAKGRRAPQDVWETLPLTKPAEDEDAGADPFGFADETHAAQQPGKWKGDDWDLENMCRQPFWIAEETVSLPKGNAAKNVAVHMLPFTMGAYTCQVSFFEPELGEFCYLISADVSLPRPADKIDSSALQGQTTCFALSFNAKNAPFEKALGVLTEARIKNANKKIKARVVLQSYMAAGVVREDQGSAQFAIDFTAPFFACRRSFPMVSEYLRWPGGATSSSNSKVKKVNKTALEVVAAPDADDAASNAHSRALLSFAPNKAGQYRCLAVVYAEDNPRDVRCVELNVLAKVPDTHMTLEFRGPARKLYAQEIPVANETDEDWTLAVTVLGRGFSAEKLLQVPAQATRSLAVQFFPLSAGDVDGKLQLRNAVTNDVFEYALLGRSDEPLAEESLSFRCNARKKTSFSVQLPALGSLLQAAAPATPRLFNVETDLPYTFCAETCELLPDSAQRFELTVNSPLGGKLLGSLTFSDPESGASFWYAVTVVVASPTEERVIEVSTTVRQGCVVDILLQNPVDDDVQFSVRFEGDGLQGADVYALPARSATAQAAPYELVYRPLLAGSFTGRVSFTNEVLGELWYKLSLTALPAPPTPLALVEAMLGAEVALLDALAENPVGEPVVYSVESTDPEHFAVAQTKLQVAPYGSAQVPVVFRPSTLHDLVSADVVLSNRTVGELRFRVQGRGLLPGVMAPVLIDAPLREIVSKSIVFRNPCSRPLTLDVSLSADGAASEAPAEVFSLLLRKQSDVVLAPRAVWHIPVAFTPPAMGVFGAAVNVRSSLQGRELLWCYPVEGTAEVGQPYRLPSLSTPAKTSLVREHVIPLAGLPASLLPTGGAPAGQDVLRLTEFALTLDVDENLRALVLRSFKLQPLEIVSLLPEHADSSATPPELSGAALGLRCRLVFEPLRVFAATLQVSLTSRLRGKWRAKLDLEALDPAPDDVIRLCAAVGAVDKVSFGLRNRFLGYSPFQAFFGAHSSPHFSVTPQTGALAPHDRPADETTTFVVSFAPREYGAIEQGVLHILTEDAQWSYVVKGSYPDSLKHGSLRR